MMIKKLFLFSLIFTNSLNIGTRDIWEDCKDVEEWKVIDPINQQLYQVNKITSTGTITISDSRSAHLFNLQEEYKDINEIQEIDVVYKIRKGSTCSLPSYLWFYQCKDVEEKVTLKNEKGTWNHGGSLNVFHNFKFIGTTEELVAEKNRENQNLFVNVNVHKLDSKGNVIEKSVTNEQLLSYDFYLLMHKAGTFKEVTVRLRMENKDYEECAGWGAENPPKKGFTEYIVLILLFILGLFLLLPLLPSLIPLIVSLPSIIIAIGKFLKVLFIFIWWILKIGFYLFISPVYVPYKLIRKN